MTVEIDGEVTRLLLAETIGDLWGNNLDEEGFFRGRLMDLGSVMTCLVGSGTSLGNNCWPEGSWGWSVLPRDSAAC